MTWRPPRRLHAGAWWAWALGLAFAAGRTTNPLLLALILAVAFLVVAGRGDSEGWLTGFRLYVLVGAFVIGIRLAFRILLGGDMGTHVLFALPSLDLAGGITLGGPVTVEEVAAGGYDGLRLATIIVCVGAANALADPRRLLGSFPRALGEVATAVTVALALVPQLVESVSRIRAARRLRGEIGRGWRSVRSLLAPTLEDALGRSLALAASMDSRGYGRPAVAFPLAGRRSRHLGWAALFLGTAGMISLLTLAAAAPGVILLAGAGAAAVASLRLRGRGVHRSRYRPDPWGGPEWAVTLAGVASVVGVTAAGALSPTHLHPSFLPLQWPALHPLAVAGVGVAALALVASPPAVPGLRPVAGQRGAT